MAALLFFLLGVQVLVTVHEFGHYWVARRCGIAVRRFSIGFGAPLWRWQRSPTSTEFVVARWPLGGYVRMVDESDGAVEPELLPHAFNRQRLVVRAAVVAAGPLANLLFALLAYALVYMVGSKQLAPVVATPTPTSLAAEAGVSGGDWLRSWRRVDATEAIELHSLPHMQRLLIGAAAAQQDVELGVSRSPRGPVRHLILPLSRAQQALTDADAVARLGLGLPWMAARVRDVAADSAAARAGLRVGDRVRAVDSRPVEDAEDLRQRIRAAVGADAQARTQLWEVQRADAVLQLQVTPAVVLEAQQAVGRAGIVLGDAAATVEVQTGPWEALQRAWADMLDVAALTLSALGQMITGQMAWSGVSGPVGIAQVAGASGSGGTLAFLQFLAFFSVNLAVLNLLPIPVLDGGHLMYYLWELGAGRPPSERMLRATQRAGFAALMLLMGVALTNDLVRLLN